MNTSQFLSLVRWLLNAVSGGIIAYTAAKSPAAQGAGAYIAQLITGPDVVSAGVLGLTWLWGHLTHSTPLPASASAGSPKAGGVALLAALGVASFLFTGCAGTPVTVAYKAAGATDVTVQAALAAYDQFAKNNETTPAQNEAVQNAFLKYQAAYAVLCDERASGQPRANAGTSQRHPDARRSGEPDSIVRRQAMTLRGLISKFLAAFGRKQQTTSTKPKKYESRTYRPCFLACRGSHQN